MVFSQRPSPLEFWYRQSREPLTATTFHSDLLTPGIVETDDPPPIMSGMTDVTLDHEGRLTLFETIPPQRLDAPIVPSPVDWGPLFTLAGSGPDEAAAGRTAVELAGGIRHARRLDRHLARKRTAAARRSRGARRPSGGVHGGRTLAQALAHAG